MKIVGLISGGKDSIYNLMECVRQGHEIECVANLRPQPNMEDELDSEMYQTVGWNGVDLIAQCLDVPLYVCYTNGKSTQNSLIYNDLKIDNNDQVEDMYKLLKNVLSKHPNVKGVSTGAILSNYQRIRVESVCNRLNLSSLCYLWQRNDQSKLLYEMCFENNISAMIIKVACYGMLPSVFLGRMLNDETIYNKLLELEKNFQINVCGEGGEYESFVLDCPLFKKKKIVVSKYQIMGGQHNLNDPINPNGYISFENKDLSIVNKNEKEIELSKQFFDQINEMNKTKGNNNNDDRKVYKSNYFNPIISPKCIYQTLNTFSSQNQRYLVNFSENNGIFQFVCHPNVSVSSKYVRNLTLKQEIDLLFDLLSLEMKKIKMGYDQIFYCHLLVNDMSLFDEINVIYKGKFEKETIYAPSRVCCQVDLTGAHRVSLEAIGFANKKRMENDKSLYDMLHVRSISHWAPSCIGPYSQASKLFDKFIFVAGMIGLVPGSMTMVKSDNIKDEIEQCWNNVSNVLTVFDGSLQYCIQQNVFALAICQNEETNEHANEGAANGANDDLYDNNNMVYSMDENKMDEMKFENGYEDLDDNEDDKMLVDFSAIDDDNIEDDDIDCDVYQSKQISILKNEMKEEFTEMINESIAQQMKQNEEANDNNNNNYCNYCVFYVSKLPKNALVEIQTICLTKRHLKSLEQCIANESNNDSKNDNSMSESKSESKNDSKDVNKGGNNNNNNETSKEKTEKIEKIERKENDTMAIDKPKRKLKYAHLRKRRKKEKSKYVGNEIYNKQIVNELGNILRVVNSGTFNILSKWINFVSLCEMRVDNVINIKHFDIEMMNSMVQRALKDSMRGLQGFANIVFEQSDVKKVTEWILNSLVFIRVYYHCELLEPQWLLQQMEEILKQSSFAKVPAISLIPTRGMNFVAKQQLDTFSTNRNNRGLFCLHVLIIDSRRAQI